MAKNKKQKKHHQQNKTVLDEIIKMKNLRPHKWEGVIQSQNISLTKYSTVWAHEGT